MIHSNIIYSIILYHFIRAFIARFEGTKIRSILLEYADRPRTG